MVVRPGELASVAVAIGAAGADVLDVTVEVERLEDLPRNKAAIAMESASVFCERNADTP
jgi:hypothetical protein